MLLCTFNNLPNLSHNTAAGIKKLAHKPPKVCSLFMRHIPYHGFGHPDQTTKTQFSTTKQECHMLLDFLYRCNTHEFTTASESANINLYL